jgi:hypothetical protein
MAKPRIFVSSTYYDLKHIRNSIETFIIEMGYDPILFESGEIPFKSDLTLDESCYKEIQNSHMQVLIIGGKYGTPDSKTPVKTKTSKEDMYSFYNSITKNEYKTALDQGIPVYIFVEKQVLAEYDTYKNNRDNSTINYAHVDSINIFKLLDEIYAQRTGNYIKGFEKSDDITIWLKDQWAGIFADYLKRNQNTFELKTLSARINDLGNITGALKEYTEAIMRKIKPENFEKLIDEEDKKIEFEKALNFSRESMIDYLIKKGNSKDTKIQLYDKFKSADSLDEFIQKLNIIDNIKEDLLVHNRTLAEKDFYEYKLRYQNKRQE